MTNWPFHTWGLFHKESHSILSKICHVIGLQKSNLRLILNPLWNRTQVFSLEHLPSKMHAVATEQVTVGSRPGACNLFLTSCQITLLKLISPSTPFTTFLISDSPNLQIYSTLIICSHWTMDHLLMKLACMVKQPFCSDKTHNTG